MFACLVVASAAVLLFGCGSRGEPQTAPARDADASAPVARLPRSGPSSPRLERLATLAFVWGQTHFLHPYLYEGGRTVDFDAALGAAIPRAAAAASDDELRAALQAMLDTLGDPMTRIVARRSEVAAPRKSEVAWLDEPGRVLRVVLAGDRTDTRWIGPQWDRAETVVFDLRVAAGQPTFWQGATLHDLAPALATHPTHAPAQRTILHSGYHTQVGMTSAGGYATTYQVAAPSVVVPKGAQRRRAIFIVNAWSSVPEEVLALQASGDARVVSEGPLEPIAAKSARYRLAGGAELRLRIGQFERPVRADVEVPPDEAPDGPAALGAASRLASLPQWAPPRAAAPEVGPLVWRADPADADLAVPPPERRLLGLFRFWNTIHLFYPYVDLLDRDWDDVLRDFIPRFEEAADPRAYALTIAELASQVTDGHVWVNGSAVVDRELGTRYLHVSLARIEGELVITRIDDQRIKDAGLAIGDVVLAVDGEAIDARVARIAPYVTASTPAARTSKTDFQAMCGAGDEATLRVRGADDRPRDVRVPRGLAEPVSEGDAVRILEGGNVGFVDLARLGGSDQATLPARLGATHALVVDLRHGHRGSPVEWVNRRHAPVACVFERPLVGGEERAGARLRFVSELSAYPDAQLYNGRVIVLIDETVISSSETVALGFEAAGADFVGVPTAGADGDVTSVMMPGSISVAFSGQAVEHADGSRLQRRGVQPRVVVRPTLAGLRAGRDEVLERAIALASSDVR